MNALDWHKAEKAVELLCEMDAAERESDRLYGFGWTNAAHECSERAKEIEDELDDLRRAAVNDFANATGHPEEADEWFDAWQEADNEADDVGSVMQIARRNRWGNRLLERAA